jgi:hypothetical protein
MVYFMGRRNDNSNGPPLPPRIKAAFDYLDHVRAVTTQYEAALPARELSSLEKSVELAALRALQQYLLGEMDFAEKPAPPPPQNRDDDEDGTAPAPSGCPT